MIFTTYQKANCILISAYAPEQDDCYFASAELPVCVRVCACVRVCVSLYWMGLTDPATALQGQHVHGLNYSLPGTFILRLNVEL